MVEKVGAYRIAVRGKKWWRPIFPWLCNVAISNGWALIRSTGSKISQHELLRKIAQRYLRRSDNKTKVPRARRTSALEDRALFGPRYDPTADFVGTVNNAKGEVRRRQLQQYTAHTVH